MDSDDYLELDACEECVKILDENTEMICFNAYIINNAKIPIENYFTDTYSIEKFFHILLKKIILRGMLGANYLKKINY